MKKKCTAFFVLLAMLLTLLPTAAFAATMSGSSNIDITVASFDNKMAEQNNYVLVIIDGNDVSSGQRVSCYLDGVDSPLYTGVLTAGQNIIYLDKKNIPGIENTYENRHLTVTVTNTSGTSILRSGVFTKQLSANEAKQMVVTIDDGINNNNRLVNVKFDSEFSPSVSDRVRLTALDAAGNAVGSTSSINVSAGYLNDKTDSDGMRALTNKQKISFASTAKTVRAEFIRDNEVVSSLTKEVSLVSQYGEFKRLDLEFANDVVAAGENVRGTLYYVNTDNKRYDITKEALYVYNNSDVIVQKDSKTPSFTVTNNAKEGATIQVTAYYGSQFVQKTLRVGTVNKVTLDKDTANINRDVTLQVSTVDANGRAKALNFIPTKVAVRLMNASDSDAKVSLKAGSLANLAKDGTFTATVTCDRPTTGVFEFTFMDDKGNSYKAVSKTFNFQQKSTKVEKRTVLMGINSKDMLINGNKSTTDTTPIIQNNRTFVPIRALVEAFGAEVEWDEKAQKVTINYGTQEVVMTIGSKTYTVDGKQKTMDVAPFIVKESSRTMVPVRFVAEALGFKVTPSYYSDGTTSNVLFAN